MNSIVSAQHVASSTSQVVEDFILVVLGQEDPEAMGYELTSARLSLGAGEKDDVYLADVGVVPGHIEMIFLDGRITVLSASEAIWADGERLSHFPFEWPAQSTLSFGPDTHLSYGSRGAEWPDANGLRDLIQRESNDAEMGEDTSSIAPANPSPSNEFEPYHNLPMTPRAQVIHSARLAVWALAAATVIVIFLVVADLLWGTRDVINPSEMAIDRSELALNRLLESDLVSYRSVKLTERPDGALALTGFIESESAYRNLAEQVRQEDSNSRGNVRLDALTSPRLLALVEDQLAGYPVRADLQVTRDEVRLTLVGLALESNDMIAIRDRLQRLGNRVAPRSFEIDMQLEPPEVITREIEDALRLGATTRELSFKIENDGGRITGLVAASVEAETRQDLEAISKSFEQRLPLTLDIQVDEKINFTVVSLSQGGEVPLATLVQYGNPTTFLQGEAVYGRAKLLEIRSDGVALLLGRRQIFLPLII
ncbi:MAG: hypothetical protein VW831_06740 [Gammaproteobacteria bacterium]